VDPANCVGNSNNVKFAKFYNFSSADGTRQPSVNLDGKGKKAMPGPCITCHGGRGDPLTPDEGSPAKPRFPLVENSLSRKRGDVQGRLNGMNVGSFGYSAQAGFTRVDQEAKLKTFNQWILCTYPLAGAAAGAEDTCRVPAGANEWQGTGPGTASDVIKAWYGGAGMPMTTFSDNPLYVPSGWSGNPSLYTDVVAPFCRTCHIVRGTANQSDIDFTTLTKFQGYADRIKAHVFDRGTMPLALIVYDDFWRSSAPQTLASFLDPLLPVGGKATSVSGEALRPGRPIADPGPNRMVKTATSATLSAENSLFATTFQWSSSAVSIINPNSIIATFPPSPAGSYTVTLKVSNGTLSDSKDVAITVDDNFPDPATLKFAHVKNVLQNVVHKASAKCVDCHKDVATPAPINTPAISYTSFDRNGSGGAADTTDDDWFLKALAGRVNLTEIQASPLLRKPSGNHHAGNDPIDLSTPAGLSNYSILYNWILAGMPAGGVAADPVVNNGVDPAVRTFGGTFPGPYSASIPLDGSQSLAPSGVTLTYTWSVSQPAGQPTGGNPVIVAGATPATPTLTVQNVGVYVAQLQVSGGGFTDTAQRTITVSETPIVADFTPQTGSTAVTFANSPATGNITLTPNISALDGSPKTCHWRVLSGPGVSAPGFAGPGGPTLDGSATLDRTKACTFSATLTVPFTAVGAGAYQVQLTASTATSSSITHDITVTNGTPVTSSISVTSTTALAFSGNPPFAFVSLSGAASSGVQPLSYAWSITAQPTGAVVASAITTGASTSTLTARATGSYQVRLIVTDAAFNTATAFSNFTVTPSRGTTFATMTTLLGPVASGGIGCTGCHVAANNNPAINSGTAPSWVNATANDGSSLWQRVSARAFNGSSTTFNTLVLNPQNIADPTFNPGGHGGGCQPLFGCGNGVGSANLTTFENWTQDGSPPGN
jgi:hypothetical protein